MKIYICLLAFFVSASAEIYEKPKDLFDYPKWIKGLDERSVKEHGKETLHDDLKEQFKEGE